MVLSAVPTVLEEQLEGRVSAMSGQLGVLLNGELDKRFQSLYDHVQAQVRIGKVTVPLTLAGGILQSESVHSQVAMSV